MYERYNCVRRIVNRVCLPKWHAIYKYRSNTICQTITISEKTIFHSILSSKDPPAEFMMLSTYCILGSPLFCFLISSWEAHIPTTTRRVVACMSKSLPSCPKKAIFSLPTCAKGSVLFVLFPCHRVLSIFLQHDIINHASFSIFLIKVQCDDIGSWGQHTYVVQMHTSLSQPIALFVYFDFVSCVGLSCIKPESTIVKQTDSVATNLH